MASTVETVRGKHVVVHFEGKRCIHSRGCVLGRPDVFVPNAKGEWIHPDAASAEAVAEIAHNCPSGAIRYERLDGGPEETAPIVNLVRVREDGPLAVSADIRIEGQEPALRATLCRCGASKNKPYCDTSHKEAGFKATGEPGAGDIEALAARDGALVVKPIKNGPLVVTGNLEVVTGTGRTIRKATSAAFCRCGQSSNKPYCDGTHNKVGFTTE